MNFLIERINSCATLCELESMEYEVKEADDKVIIEAYNNKKNALTVR
jgi:hypothetical protein